MPTTQTFAPTYASVDLTALAHNLTQFRRTLAAGCDVMAVVKANAYGHGAQETAKALIQQGVPRLAVVSVNEGLELRQAGITVPIVILGSIFHEQFQELIAHRLTPVVSDLAILTSFGKATASLATPIPIHLKVDTGMGRLGLTQNELEDVIRTHTFPLSLQLEGLMTHLSDTDGPDEETTIQQLSRFEKARLVVRDGGFRVPMIHVANSAGAVRFPATHFSLVRPGIMLYGYHTLPPSVMAPDLRPVLSLKTRIAQLRTIPAGGTVSYNRTFRATRTTRVAILPIGYADGMSRYLSNRGAVLIHGQRAPIVGLVCMDMIMVDVTTITEAVIGDEVVLIGQQGKEKITAQDLAQLTGSIPYEVLCAIGPRIPRQYHTT